MALSGLVAGSDKFILSGAQMTIDDDTWSIIAGDPDLDIDATEPACFTGRIKISFPAVGSQPAYDQAVFLLFLVNSDGVINY
jgi:hypothetical protein